MKLKQCYFVVIFGLLLFSCQADKVIASKETIPPCLKVTIDKMAADLSEGSPVSITRFLYRGKKVYYMVASCCDKYNIVYDSTCAVLGYPDGGFTGRGDGKMPGFAKEAIEPKVIWEAGITSKNPSSK